MNAGRVRIVSHSSCRTSAILKYFCPLLVDAYFVLVGRELDCKVLVQPRNTGNHTNMTE